MFCSEKYVFITPIVLIVITSFILQVSSFNVGVKSTKCDAENDPCASLYDAVCDGAHCKCPPGSFEDKGLKRCKTGKAPKKKEDIFDDLPLDYVPGKKPQPKPDAGGGGAGVPSPPRQPVPQAPTEAPRRPPPPPQQPKEPANQGGGDPRIGEKAGGGVGGALGLIAIVALVYFKCCKGGKGKDIMGKLPFFGGGRGQNQTAGGAQYQMSNQQQGPAEV